MDELEERLARVKDLLKVVKQAVRDAQAEFNAYSTWLGNAITVQDVTRSILAFSHFIKAMECLKTGEEHIETIFAILKEKAGKGEDGVGYCCKPIEKR